MNDQASDQVTTRSAGEPAAPVEGAPRSVGTFPTAPLLIPAAGMIAGIMLSAAGWRPVPLIVPAVVLTALYPLLAIRSTRRTAPESPHRARRIFGECAVLTVAIAAGATMHTASAAPGPLAQIAANRSPLVRVRGIVTETPRLIPRSDALLARFSFHTERSVMTVRAHEIDTGTGWVAADGSLRATLREVALDIESGDRVELLGFLRPLRSPANPGAFDWSAHLKRRGIEADLLCASRGNVRVTGRTNRTSENSGLRARLLERARALLFPSTTTANADEGRLIDALILGQRSRAGRALSESFARAGASHFLAVSGMHIGILAGLVWIVCRTLGAKPTRSAALVILITILYATLAEPRPPVLRATLMTTIFCTGIALRRRPAPLNSLAAAAIALLVWRPLDLFDVGFQLSFIAVLGILLIGVPASQRLSAALESARRGAKTPNGKRYRRFRRMIPRPLRSVASWSATALFVSLAAWASTLPISLATFHEWHPYAPLIALLLMPVVAALLAAGLIALTLGAIAPPIAYICSALAAWTEATLLTLVELLGTLPGTTIVSGTPPRYWTVLFYLALAGIAAGLRRCPARERAIRTEPIELDPLHPNRRANITTIASTLFAIAVSLTWHFDRGSDHLHATFLAVGDGSAAVIELPTGETLLLDAGSLTSPAVGRTTVAAFLQHRGIRRIDEIIISHANLDHYGGIPEVVRAIDVGRVTITQQFLDHAKTHRASSALVEFLLAADIPIDIVSPPAITQRGNVLIEHLWPPPDANDLSTNDSSLVTRVSIGESSILFTGDIEEEAIATILDNDRIACDILVLPHHGQVVPSTPALLANTGANLLIRSTNQRRADTTNGLFDLAGDHQVLSTADIGAICVTMSKQTATAARCLAE